VVATVTVGKVKEEAQDIPSFLSGPNENKFATVSKIRHHSSYWPSLQTKKRMGCIYLIWLIKTLQFCCDFQIILNSNYRVFF
jgi:hypothetical protein